MKKETNPQNLPVARTKPPEIEFTHRELSIAMALVVDFIDPSVIKNPEFIAVYHKLKAAMWHDENNKRFPNWKKI